MTSYMDSDKLIEMLEENECLWRVDCKGYRDRDKRRVTFEIVAGKMGLTVHDVKKKIQNLRTYFARECSKSLRKSGAEGTGDRYESNWKHFNQMKFLLPYTENRRNIPHLDRMEYMEDFSPQLAPSPSASDESSPTHQYPCGHKRKLSGIVPPEKKSKQTEDDSLSLAVENHNKESKNDAQPESELQLFGRYIVTQLEKIENEQSRAYAKLRIQQIICEAQFGEDFPKADA